MGIAVCIRCTNSLLKHHSHSSHFTGIIFTSECDAPAVWSRHYKISLPRLQADASRRRRHCILHFSVRPLACDVRYTLKVPLQNFWHSRLFVLKNKDFFLSHRDLASFRPCEAVSWEHLEGRSLNPAQLSALMFGNEMMTFCVLQVDCEISVFRHDTFRVIAEQHSSETMEETGAKIYFTSVWMLPYGSAVAPPL